MGGYLSLTLSINPSVLSPVNLNYIVYPRIVFGYGVAKMQSVKDFILLNKVWRLVFQRYCGRPTSPWRPMLFLSSSSKTCGFYSHVQGHFIISIFEAPVFILICQTTGKKGSSYSTISHTFAHTSLAQTEFHGHVWLQLKLENVVLSLGILATFLYILSQLDGIHFCAQMERNERSTGREGWCAIMR